MYSINNISLQFSGVELLNNVSLIINKKERIGLVGKNGAGKTTILKILAGTQQTDSGSISLPVDTTIGFLPQEILFTGTQSVFKETLNAFEKIISLKKTIDNCQNDLEKITNYNSDQYEKLVQKLNTCTEQYNLLGGFGIDAETEKILLGLGFSKEQMLQPVSTFSGGWRMRIELAKILLQKPDLLLLDEPTNHLDIESIQWFEDFLLKYNGAVIVVSHDRMFLDNITTRTVEINLCRIYDYDVPYSKYIIKRNERIEQQTAEYENQQKLIEQTEKFIERFRYKSTKAKQVQSRIKMLDKLDLKEVDEIDNSHIFFKFPPAPASGKIVVEAENLNKKYGDKEVLHKLDFIINKGDKIAFVGKNGEGKTTLSRIIVGELNHDGACKLGYNVNIGYYAQNETENLNPEKTVLETIDDVAVGEIRPKIRSILGSFLFSGDAVNKKVKVLSGGEKSRLALAKLLLKPVNLLLLDEPTNHLDMKAKDILKQALINYDGTLIIVSHDRHFLQDLTNKVFEFKNKNIKQYIGDVFDFLKSRKIENLRSLEINDKIQQESENKKDSSLNKQNREKKKNIARQLRKAENEIAEIETQIENSDMLLKNIEHKLEHPEKISENENYSMLYEDYKNTKIKHDTLMEQWSILHEDLEKLKQEV